MILGGWVSLDLTDDKSTLIQVLAWCRQATIHYLSQCWPISVSPYDSARSQRVDISSKQSGTLRVNIQQHVTHLWYRWFLAFSQAESSRLSHQTTELLIAGHKVSFTVHLQTERMKKGAQGVDLVKIWISDHQSPVLIFKKMSYCKIS